MSEKCLVLLIGLGFAVAANANVIASYDFDSEADFSAKSVGDHIIAGSFDGGSGALTPVVSGGLIKAAQSKGISAVKNSTEADAVAANQYFTFNVAVEDGYTLDLESLTIDLYRGKNSCKQYSVYTVAGGVTSSVSLTENAVYETSTTKTIDLTANTYDSVENIDFYFYFYDRDSTSNPSSAVFVDNVTLNGVSVVPEPATIGMVGIGALALMFIRKRISV